VTCGNKGSEFGACGSIGNGKGKGFGAGRGGSRQEAGTARERSVRRGSARQYGGPSSYMNRKTAWLPD